MAILESGAPSEQEHDAMEDYVPDYTVSPLVLTPDFRIDDPDGQLAGGSVNASASFQWETSIDGGAWAAIPSASVPTTDYTYNSTGDANGTLTWKANIPAGSVRSFRVKAVYTDPRTGDKITRQDVVSASCLGITEGAPRIVIEGTPRALRFNKVRDVLADPTGTIAIKAMLRSESGVFVNLNTDTKWGLKWQVMQGGVWKDITGAVADLQWEFSVAKDAQWLTLTLKRMEMAEVTRLRAVLYPKSEPTKIVRTAHTAHVAFVPRLARRLEMSKFAQPGQSGIPAKLTLTDSQGVVANVDAVASTAWKTCQATASTDYDTAFASAPTVATGASVRLPSSMGAAGMGVEVSSAIKGQSKGITHGGKILTYNGKVLTHKA